MPTRAIMNPTIVAAPTTAPAAAMPSVATAHYYSMPTSVGKARGYIIIENQNKSVAASEWLEPIDRAEFELHGYVSPDDKPSLLLRLVITSGTGRVQTPFEFDTCDMSKIYIKQGGVDATPNATATAQNPKFNYQLVWE